MQCIQCNAMANELSPCTAVYLDHVPPIKFISRIIITCVFPLFNIAMKSTWFRPLNSSLELLLFLLFNLLLFKHFLLKNNAAQNLIINVPLFIIIVLIIRRSTTTTPGSVWPLWPDTRSLSQDSLSQMTAGISSLYQVW